MSSDLKFLGIVQGVRVRLTRTADRYPNFEIAAGATGTIDQATDDLISMKIDAPVAGAEQWDNCLQWSPRNGGPDDLNDFLASVARLDGSIWGAPADVMASETFRYLLARRFAELLRDTLSEREVDEVVIRNKAEATPGVCHSHDFLDANSVMMEAWVRTAGRAMDSNDDAQAAAWSAAWALAAKGEFVPPALVHGARYRGEWGAAEFVKAGTAERSGSFFCPANAYTAEDMKAIAALEVGQRWQSPDYSSHRVTRIS